MKTKNDLNLVIGKTAIAGDVIRVVVNSAPFGVELSITSDIDQELYDYRTFDNWSQAENWAQNNVICRRVKEWHVE